MKLQSCLILNREALEKELSELNDFIFMVSTALSACESYRKNQNSLDLEQIKASYNLLLVEQTNKFARLYMPKLAVLGARAHCRSCAYALVMALEVHLIQDAEDTFTEYLEKLS